VTASRADQMDNRHGTSTGWQTPRIDTEEACTGCPGRWIYDEAYGWLPSPDHPAGCATPPELMRAAVIR
jgi:hypothetical protein